MKNPYEQRFKQLCEEKAIIHSQARFKIALFFKKAQASYLIALQHQNPQSVPEKVYWWHWSIIIAYYSMLFAAKAILLEKGYEVKTHEAAEIALGYLCVPDELEKEDLEILQQTHTLLEEDFITSFQDARRESNTARYQARPSYTHRRVKELLRSAKVFIQKTESILFG